MLAIQHYVLTVPRVDVNGALMDDQNNDVGGIIQHPGDSKGSMQEIQLLRRMQRYTIVKMHDHIFKLLDDNKQTMFVIISLD